MRQFQISENFDIKKGSDIKIVRQQFEKRLGELFDILSIDEDADGQISIQAFSGTKCSAVNSAEMNVKCDLMVEDGKLRFMAGGSVRASRSQVILYTLGLFIVLLIGLLPGSLNTSWEDAGAGDAAIFLIIGGYIVYDIETKLMMTEQLMRDVVAALKTEFVA